MDNNIMPTADSIEVASINSIGPINTIGEINDLDGQPTPGDILMPEGEAAADAAEVIEEVTEAAADTAAAAEETAVAIETAEVDFAEEGEELPEAAEACTAEAVEETAEPAEASFSEESEEVFATEAYTAEAVEAAEEIETAEVDFAEEGEELFETAEEAAAEPAVAETDKAFRHGYDEGYSAGFAAAQAASQASAQASAQQQAPQTDRGEEPAYTAPPAYSAETSTEQRPGQSQAAAGLALGILSLVLPGSSIVGLIRLGCAIAGLYLSADARKKGFIGGIQKGGYVVSIIGLVLSALSVASWLTCASCFTLI